MTVPQPTGLTYNGLTSFAQLYDPKVTAVDCIYNVARDEHVYTITYTDGTVTSVYGTSTFLQTIGAPPYVSWQSTTSSASNPPSPQLGVGGYTLQASTQTYQSLLGNPTLTASSGGYSQGVTYALIGTAGTFVQPNPYANITIANAPKSPALKTESWVMGELVGWRVWTVTASGFLKSVTSGTLWPTKEPMDGKTKSTEEHCGIYSYKKQRKMFDDWINPPMPYVYGSVWLWGDIIEHEEGYRAEFAKVRSLDGWFLNSGPHAASDLASLRHTYGLEA